MRTDTAAFTTRNRALVKRPRYVIELAFDSANSILWYFTSHSDAALPEGASAIPGVVEGLSGTSQTLKPDVANASIGNINFSLVDSDSVVTETLGGQLVLGRSTRRQRVRVYVGFEGLAWADYTLVQTQLVTEISYDEGAYKFSCADVQREMRKDIFELATTTLAASVSAGATTIDVVSTAAFAMVAHGPSFSDAPNATVGYVKIQDEVIRYTSKTPTQFILGAGGQRGALNTLAAEHAVDLTAAADRRTPVEEYIFLEMPAVKLMYAMLTGVLLEQFDNTGTAQGGSVNSLTLAAAAPDVLIGSSLRLLTGSGSEQEREVLAYDTTTKIATVSPWGVSGSSVRCQDNTGQRTICSVTGMSSSAMSVEMWVQIDTPGDYFCLARNWVTNGWLFGITSIASGRRATFGVGNAAGAQFNANSPVGEQMPLGVPIHLVGTYDGATVRLYVNGVLQGITAALVTSTINTAGSAILDWRANVTGEDARADGVRMYSRALSGTEVGEHYVDVFNDESGLVCHWDFDEGSGGTVADKSGNGNVGTVEGGATWVDGLSVTLPDSATTYGAESILPAAWHLGVPASYARASDFAGIGDDLWTTTDDAGFITRFEGLEKTDGKKFIETELALLSGLFMPVYADGSLGLRRMANVLAGASYVSVLDSSNLVAVDELVHDFDSLHNVLQITWNWETARDAFTRVNLLVDAASVTIHGKSDPLKLKFRGLHGSRHSSTILAQLFDSLRDRYTGPPLRVGAEVLPSLNTLEVGDVVRLRPPGVRDFVANGDLDRSFEIQNIAIDWVTGDLRLKLFGSSQAPGALPATADATVLSDAWYTSTGTALSSVVTITGSNPGHVTAGGTLASGVYYYSGDLVIDPGVTINFSGTPQLRIKGFLQNNGTLSGVGGGQAAGGTPGFIGSTQAGGGMTGVFQTLGDVSDTIYAGLLNSAPADVIVGANSSMPSFNLAWDGTTLTGLPADLRGTSGAAGGSFIDKENTVYPGGAGAAGGAGLVVVSRGFAQGVAGVINTSGNAGQVGSPFTNGASNLWYPGSGAGGAPGGLLIVLDGANVTATGLTDAGFVALNGSTPLVQGNLVDSPSFLFVGQQQPWIFASYFIGTGDGTTFPKPSLSNGRGGSRVQYVPGNVAATPDPSAVTLVAPTNLGLASGTPELLVQTDGTIIPRIKVTWIPSVDARTVGYEIQFKRSSDSVWTAIAPVLGAASDTAWISGISDALNHDVRLRAAGGTREVSAWVTITDYFVVGKSAKPANVGVLNFTDPFLSWSPITDLDRRGYIVRYHPGSNTDWASATPAHVAGFITENRFDTGDIVGGVTTLLVKSLDTSGNESVTAASLLVDLRPAQLTTFIITVQSDGTRELNWSTSVIPADWEGIHVRYILGDTDDWDEMTPMHNGVLKAAPFETNQLAAGVYTFAAKNVDRAGNESADPLFITSVELSDPRFAGALGDFKEDPLWLGTKVDCHIDLGTGWLVADGTATWTTLPATWAGWTSWNHSPKSPIQYSSLIDIGAVFTFIPLVTVMGDGVQTIEEQHSDDGMSYSSYAAVGPQVSCRYIRIRVSVSGSYPKMKTMRIILSAKTIAEYIEDQNSASLAGAYRIGTGDVRVPIIEAFSSIKKVDITLQSVGAGWSWELIDKDTTVGPRIKIYNSSNTLADAVFDATVIGISA